MKSIHFSLLLVLTSALGAQAQELLPPPSPPPQTIHPDEAFWSLPVVDPEPGSQATVWLKGEYLLWWIRKSPSNTPLVTLGDAADAVPGALDQPGTHVLFGNRPFSFDAASGVRVTAGVDFLSDFGIEGSYFALERKANTFTVTSDDNGNPLIARPVFNNQTQSENAYLYSLPDAASGSVSAVVQSRLQGGELNLTSKIFCSDTMTIKALAGFRYLELTEDLGVVGNLTPLVPGFLTFMGQAADPPSTLTESDYFLVRNKFYGGQVGGQIGWRSERLSLDGTGKLGLGTTQEFFFINGLTTVNSAGTVSTNPGGLLAQPSNMGRHFHSSFAVVPELGLTAGYQLSQQFKATMGYNLLYWSKVARPGDQIDRTVNPTQVARDSNFGNGAADLRPIFQVHETDFWAQGLTFGLEFQY